MNPNNWRISTKLLTGMGAALFLALVTISLININQLQKMMEVRVVQQELPNALKGLKNAVERELVIPVTAARGIAKNTYIDYWLRTGEDPINLPKIQEFLKIASTEFNADFSFLVSNSTMNYYNAGGHAKTLTGGSRGWYDGFVASGKEFEIAVDSDKTTGGLTAFINVRVTDKSGNILGVAGLGQKLSGLSELVSQFKLSDSGATILVNAEGLIAAHPDKGQLGRPLTSILSEQEAGKLTTNNRGFDYLINQGEYGEQIIAANKIDLVPGWYILSSVPTSELYAGVYTASTNAATGGLIVGLLMLAMIVVLVKRIVNPIRLIADSLTEIGQKGGDLTQRIPFQRNDELGDLIDGFNAFMDKLHSTVSEVILNNEQLSGSLREVVDNMSTAAGQAGETQHNTDRVAAAVHEMSTTVQEIARNTHQAADASKDSEEAAADGSQVIGQSIGNIQELNDLMQESTQSVKDLAEDVTRISAVLEVIRSISEQTNLLALNAAIEAARAGELGRGFAVVADEVRALAQKTQTSTDEIHQTIERLQSSARDAVSKIDSGMAKTQEGVGLAEQAGVALEDIRGKASGITDMNIQIATATEEQSTVTEDINMNVQTISELASSCADQIQTCDDECTRIAEMADNIRNIMKQFKV